MLDDAFHETLKVLDDAQHHLTYSITQGPPPLNREAVEDYEGEVRLIPITEDNTTLIEWQSQYRTQDDAAVAEFCNPIYVGLLAALKQHLAARE